MTRDTGAEWAGYYAWSTGREPRPMLLAALSTLGVGAGRMAVDLGCGEGTDALALLDRGWSVLAVDIEDAGLALLRARIPAACAQRISIVCASFADVGLPPAHLIHGGFSCPSALRISSRPCGSRYAARWCPVACSLGSCSAPATAGPAIPA